MGKYGRYEIVGQCACCGRDIQASSEGNLYMGMKGGMFDGNHYFCSTACSKKFYANNPGGNATDNSGSSGVTSSGAGSELAGVGVGAAVAGAGMAVKGLGSLIGGLGKGVGAMGSLMKEGVKSEAKSKARYHSDKNRIKDFVFSSDPDEHQKQVYELLPLAQSKSFNLADWDVADAAKARLCAEFERLMVSNPALYAQYAGIHASLKKKLSAAVKMGILFGVLVLLILVTLIPSSMSSDKKVKAENARLEAIVKEIDDAMAQKNYEAALYNATKLQWTLNPSQHSSEVRSWNEQREKITETIKDLSGE